MGDYPVDALGGLTPLQAAAAPTLRQIAGLGETRLVSTVPEGMAPGSDVANLALLGYDAAENYTGRAAIEAAGADVELRPTEVAFRCNLVTVAAGTMDDYSAGHISTEEGEELIRALEEALGRDGLRFRPGVQYRHLLLWDDGPDACVCEPPHEFTDKPVAEHSPSGPRADEVAALMERSKAVLADHPVNRRRVAEGKKPATQIWLWGQGKAMRLESYESLYGLKGGVISAVDLLKGIAKLAGLKAPLVEGATGFVDTDYAGKVAAALDLLERDGFAFVHVEAPDECGHLGDARLKTEAIGAFDRNVVEPIYRRLEAWGEPYLLLLCTDHRTPVSLKGHTAEPVPMTVLRGPTGQREGQAPFDETVDDGIVRCRACDWIRETLKNPEAVAD